jgi:RNA polymerase sigma-70 factor (ECF subfamily)
VSFALPRVESAESETGLLVLLRRVGAGEPAAIDEVYRAHHVALRGFANRFLGDAAAAEDLVHDVFLILPGAIRRFRGESSLRTFLTAIAVKRAYKHVRSATRRRAAMSRFAEQPEKLSRAPDDEVAGAELATILYAALDKLPRDQRTAFVLCEIDQLTAGEAAAIVDAPEATVRTRLFHARKRLRDLLEEVPR